MEQSRETINSYGLESVTLYATRFRLRNGMSSQRKLLWLGDSPWDEKARIQTLKPKHMVFSYQPKHILRPNKTKVCSNKMSFVSISTAWEWGDAWYDMSHAWKLANITKSGRHENPIDCPLWFSCRIFMPKIEVPKPVVTVILSPSTQVRKPAMRSCIVDLFPFSVELLDCWTDL